MDKSQDFKPEKLRSRQAQVLKGSGSGSYKVLKNLRDPAFLAGIAGIPLAITAISVDAISIGSKENLKAWLNSPATTSILFALGSLLLLSILSVLSRRVFLETTTVGVVAPDIQNATKNIPLNGLEYYASLAEASRQVAGTLFSRSGVYLIVGVTTALFGIFLFFITRSFASPPSSTENSDIEYAVYLLQNAGVLILCELIAFFFLRQSRAVLDEFRHFDNLARYREEMLALLRFADGGESGLTAKDVFDKGSFFSRPDRLATGETTELVETRKLEKSELELLGKIAEAVLSSKKA